MSRLKSLLNPASWASAILIWSYLLLLPVRRLFELPILVMAILGGVLLWRHRGAISGNRNIRIWGVLFLCVWVPIATSIPDSMWFSKSLSTALTFPRIYLVGVYLIWMLRSALLRQRVLSLSYWLLLFWIVDAAVQAAIGYDLLGFAYPERLNGVFGPHNWKFGLTLAMLAPLLWAHVARRYSWPELLAIWIASMVIVLLASNRESWIMFAIATVLWGWHYARRAAIKPLVLFLPIVVATALVAYSADRLDPKVAVRMQQSQSALKMNYAGLEQASSLRMGLWKNASEAALDHPINGVGASAYRYAYGLYAPKGDPFLNPDGTGMLYAHQLLLEVASETGVIGLAGLLLYFAVFCAWRARPVPTR
jgi:Lipid A core - O-antigen ligase and related enzymes